MIRSVEEKILGHYGKQQLSEISIEDLLTDLDPSKNLCRRLKGHIRIRKG